MGLFDRLKPVPPKIEPVKPIDFSPPVIPEVQIVAPTPEITKPTIDLDFKPKSGMDFEISALSHAQRYTEALGSQKPADFDQKMAGFLEIMDVISKGAKAEQDTAATAESAKKPFVKLKEAILSGYDSTNQNYGERVPMYLDKSFEYIVGKVNEKLLQQHTLQPEKPKTEIISDIFSQEGNLKVDMGNLINGNLGVLDQVSNRNSEFPNFQLVSLLKSLGCVSESAPNKGQFPKLTENAYLLELLKKNSPLEESQVTQQDPNTYKSRNVTEYKVNTKIVGVKLVVGIDKDNNIDGKRDYSGNGYPVINTLRLELTPEFFNAQLGLEVSEKPAGN